MIRTVRVALAAYVLHLAKLIAPVTLTAELSPSGTGQPLVRVLAIGLDVDAVTAGVARVGLKTAAAIAPSVLVADDEDDLDDDW